MTEYRLGRSLATLRTAAGPSAVTVTAVLTSFGLAYLIHRTAGAGLDVVVQAVVLAMTMAQAASRGRGPGAPGSGWRAQLLSYALLPVVAVAAAGDGVLLTHHPDAGQVLFVLIITGSVYVRRFGPLAGRLGSLAALPLIAILIVHIPVVPGHGGEVAHALWMAASAVVVGFVVGITRAAGRRLGVIDADPPEAAPRPAAPPTPAPAPAPAPTPAAPAGGPARRRLPASTAMATQTGVALGCAFVAGHLLFPDHVMWVVLTAYIVAGGSRGRADALHTAGLRLVGAALGTVAATLVGSAFGPGERISIVAIFVVLAAATLLRAVSYAFWAAGVTAMLSLLYGYFGEVGAGFLRERLEAIGVGAVIAVAAAWLLLPVRTVDVARRWIADALADLSALLAAHRSEPAAVGGHAARLRASVLRLETLHRPLSLERRLRGSALAARFVPAGQPRPGPGERRHIADALEAMPLLLPAVDVLRTTETGDWPSRLKVLSGSVRLNVGAVRRAIGRRPGDPFRPAGRSADEYGPVAVALADIDEVLAGLVGVFGDPPPPEPKPEVVARKGQ